MFAPYKRPRLALTLGDPAGIGPEIILKALADPTLLQGAEITVIGDRRILLETYQQLRAQTDQPLADPDEISLFDCGTDLSLGHHPLGIGNAATGDASFIYLETSIQQTLAGQFDGIVTAPIAKFAWAQAGHAFPGQTEVLAQASHSERYGMLFVARSPFTGWLLRVLLATTHIPLRQVPDTLTPDLIRWKLALLTQCLQEDFGIPNPVIAVAGLNPHSGEAGQLGREELEWLTPTLQGYVGVKGPIPPDTMWIPAAQAWHQQGTPADGYLALYHDQGLIPLKVLAFDRAVNTTIGLPFVRTSPDHGTAFDITGQGIASALSLREAILLAGDLVRTRAVRVSDQSQISELDVVER